MKKNIIIILAIFILPMLAYFGLTRTNCCTAKSVDAAGKPQVIKFASAMCLDCQTMNKVFRDIMPQFSGTVIFTDINVQDKNSRTESLIKKYNVTLVPTMILLDSNGNQVRKLEGAIPAEEMTSYIKGLK